MTVIHIGDALSELCRLPSNSVDCCVTSPPYWGLRNYGVEGQLGLEPTPEEWCAKLVRIFREVRRVLKPTGTMWLNLGDCYISRPHGGGGSHDPKSRARDRSVERIGICNRSPVDGYKSKDMVGQPWMLAFALRTDGWYLRRDIIWHKPNCMPESAGDRPTTAHEYLFLLSKSEHYFYDSIAVMEPTTGNSHSRGRGVNPKAVGGWQLGPGSHTAVEHSTRKIQEPAQVRLHRPGKNSRIHRDIDPSHQTPAKIRAKQNRSFSAAVTSIVDQRNCRSVWTIPTAPYRGSHFATFPPRLAERCILAGSSAGGCCSMCGEPWLRITNKTPLPRVATTQRQDAKWTEIEQRRNRMDNHQRGVLGSGVSHNTKASPIAILGWKQSCECTLVSDPVPSVVLDPFAGAGTTLMVAKRLGRDSIGIELNVEYAAMANDRIERDGRAAS